MFIGTWWALIPPLLAIILAFVTKEVYSSLFLGVAVGAILYSGFHPWESFVNFFEIMKNSMNLNILIFDVLLGMIIVLMAKTGGSAAYGKWAGTKIKSKKSALLATTGLGILIFVDDYFNCLTVGSVMRPVTDRYKVSRAKLAYIIDSTAAPVCIIAPISSWAAAVNSYVPEDAGITGFQLFLRTIPYNLYAILTLFMVIFITVTAFDFGLMKKHEENAAKGDLFTSGAEEFEQISEDEVNPNGKVIDLSDQYYIDLQHTRISTNFGITTPDLFLMYAECLARTGNDDEAAALLEELRAARMPAANAAVPASLSGDELVRYAVAERMRENLGYGASWFDMRRLWADPLFQDMKQWYVHTDGVQEYTLTEQRLVMRIPPSVMIWHDDYVNND